MLFRSAIAAMQEVCDKVGLKDSKELAYLIGTGYGRNKVPFADENISEISCHAMGVAAGDAFNAGLVHALINDFDPQDAVNYAIAASILKLTIKGDSNLVTASEIAAVASAADGGTRVAR